MVFFKKSPTSLMVTELVYNYEQKTVVIMKSNVIYIVKLLSILGLHSLKRNKKKFLYGREISCNYGYFTSIISIAIVKSNAVVSTLGG